MFCIYLVTNAIEMIALSNLAKSESAVCPGPFKVAVSVVMIETSMSSLVFKKYVKTKLKATFIKQISADQYLAEFKTYEGE